MSKHGVSLAQVIPSGLVLPGVGPRVTQLIELPAPPFGVFLGPVSYAFAWTCIHLFHVVCALCFIAAGYIYWTLPSIYTGWMLQLYSLTIDSVYFQPIAVVHFLIAALHLRFFVTSIGYKLVTNLLSLHQQKKLRSRMRRLTLHSKHLTRQVFAPRTRRGRILSAIQFVYGVLFAPSGFFGVESQSFEIIFLCREVLETCMQAYQAYTMSRLLPRESLNRFYVAMLVLNCWTTPVLHRLTRDKAHQRLWCLVSDILFDFISAVGVPFMLVHSYLKEFDFRQADFPERLWYTDQWLMRFMGDAPLMLCGSWMDALNRLVFSLGMLISIDDVRVLIKQRDSVLPSDPEACEAARPSKTSRIVQWAHRVMLLFGFLVLAVQLHVESKPAPPSSCVVKVRPWFVQRPACALVEINCLLRPAFSSDPPLMTRVLTGMDTLSVEYLIFRHCPGFEMPTVLQQLSNLIGLKTYNSTFAKWDVDAALTQSYLPNLRFIFFVRTNFTNGELPQGLLSDNFPRMLCDIEMSITNLQSLPEDLDSKWPQRLVLVIEYSQLTQFPPVIYRLWPRGLSLCGNLLTSLPPEAFLLRTTYSVSFAGNPIVSLPEVVDPRHVSTTIFYLDMIGITTLPQWMDEIFFLSIRSMALGGSPLCVDVLLNDSASAEKEELLAGRPAALAAIDCTVLDAVSQAYYPYDLEVRENEDEF